MGWMNQGGVCACACVAEDVSTLKVGVRHFTSITRRSVSSGGTDRAEPVLPWSQPPYILHALLSTTHTASASRGPGAGVTLKSQKVRWRAADREKHSEGRM